eukprot:EG_transcript_11684
MAPRHRFEFLPITSGEPHSSGIFDHWEYEVTLLTSEWEPEQRAALGDQRLTTRHRFKDFEALRKLLHHETPGLILPPLPGLEWVGMLAKVMTNVKPDPVVVAWRMRGLSLFLDHLSGWPAAGRSDVLRHFVLDDPAAWQAFVAQRRLTAKASSPPPAFRFRRGLRARPQLFSPALLDAEAWAKQMEPEIETLKDRLEKLQHACLARRQAKPPAPAAPAGAAAGKGQDDALEALEGMAALVQRAEQSTVPQLEAWLVLLMADVAFFGGLARAAQEACTALFRLETLRLQSLESKKGTEEDGDDFQNRLDRGLELFAAEYQRLKRWKRVLCTRICHTFAKLTLHLMSTDVDWRPGGDADPWLMRLPDWP